MSSQPKNYLVGWYAKNNQINFDDTDFISLSEAAKKVKSYLVENDEEEEVWTVFEIVPVKKFKLIKNTKVVEVPIKK